MSTGKFCWFDLMTTDVPAARRFYGELFGWDIREHNAEYHMIHDRRGRMLGGVMAAQPGQPSAWLSYVTVDDIDQAVAKVREGGGTVFMQHHAPGVGRFAIYADRQGAALAAIQLETDHGPYPREKAENHICWSELHTPDPDDALAFHVAVFGWKSESWGDHHLIGDEHAGSILRARPGERPGWVLYVNTPNTNETAERVRALGGSVQVEPEDLEHVGRFAVFADPTGAVFAVMQSAPRG